MTRLRIVLAEDHKVMREGLRIVLDREADLEVVGEADDGVTAVRLRGSFDPMWWSWTFRCPGWMA